MKTGYVYITSNKNRTTFYVGVTNNIRRRMFEHRTGQSDFTSRYNVYELLYFEEIWGMGKAIAREKQLKNWHRQWKINLIKEKNPEMVDLSQGWFTSEQLEEGRRRAREMLKQVQHNRLAKNGDSLSELGSETVEATEKGDSKTVETTERAISEASADAERAISEASGDPESNISEASADAESSSAFPAPKDRNEKTI